ncbi:MAG TPA: hypothetical protein VM755_21910 [Stellaceae bacterium]|nr:hypothetical protein [Stellaceae bacterium]
MNNETLLKLWKAMELIGEAREACGRGAAAVMLASAEATLMLALIAAAEAAQTMLVAA